MSVNRKGVDLEKFILPVHEWPIDMIETVMRDADRKFKRTGDVAYLVRKHVAEQIYADHVTDKLNE